MRQHYAKWTPDRLETLRTLWAAGWSGSEISRRLGGVTRNAVMGKVHRLKLQARLTRSKPPKRKKHTSRPPSHIAPDLALVGTIACVADLTPRSCRYIIGDPAEPAWAYCGRPRRDDATPYCAAHHAVCYHPTKQRERAK